MTSAGEWTPQEIASSLASPSWRGLSSLGADDFTGIGPFDLMGRHGSVTAVSMSVENGTIASLHRSERARAALVSHAPPLLGPSAGPPTMLRVGDVVEPLSPFDEARFSSWSFPSLTRGGAIVICHELTGTVDGDAAAWFVFRDGVLERVHDREPEEAARQAGIPFMRLRTTWLARLRWRLGEITTLEMASGSAIRVGSWSTLDYALATADRAQSEMRADPLPLAGPLRWLAAATRGQTNYIGWSTYIGSSM